MTFISVSDVMPRPADETEDRWRRGGGENYYYINNFSNDRSRSYFCFIRPQVSCTINKSVRIGMRTSGVYGGNGGGGEINFQTVVIVPVSPVAAAAAPALIVFTLWTTRSNRRGEERWNENFL